MNIFILDPIHADGVTLLRQNPLVRTITWDDPAIHTWQDEADGLIVRGTPLPAEELRRACRLKVVGRHGAGYDKVDLTALKEKGIALVNTPFENTEAVAELVVGLMLATARNLQPVSRHIRTGNWACRNTMGGSELSGSTVGFIGFGRIAQTAARMLKGGFNPSIVAFDPFIAPDSWNELSLLATRCDSLEALFAQCDFISLHVPKTPSTLGMINADLLAKSKPGLALINTARGGVVDEHALYEALVAGTVRAAAFDVFDKEPLNPAAPLLQLENFIATPHYAGSTRDALRRVGTAVAREVLGHLLGNGNPAYRVV